MAAAAPRPMIPPRPNGLQRAISSRLQYPRLASCDVGFYSGPSVTIPALPALPPASASSSSSVSESFHGEEAALRTIAQVRSGWESDAAARRARTQARQRAEELRLQQEADAAAAAQKAADEATAARLAAEVARQAELARQRELARLAQIAREAAEAEERRKAKEAEDERRRIAAEEEQRDREEAEKLRAEEQAIAARKAELERKQQERAAAYAPPVARPVNPIGTGAYGSPAAAAAASSSAASPSASQLAFERSFQELTGINNSAQIRTLLSALQYDLDRAIAIFFAEDPPSMDTALEKATSIQQNAQQHHLAHPASGSGSFSQQQQQQQQQQPLSQLARLQVLLPDGTPMQLECAATDTFWTLYERLSQPLSSRPAWANKSISFALVTFPHTVFTEQKFDVSMQEAGLVPNGTLRIELSR